MSEQHLASRDRSTQEVIQIDAAGNPVGGSASPVITQEKGATTGTVTRVASAATDTIILAADVRRRFAIVTNESTAILSLLIAAGTASATNYTITLGPTAAGVNSSATITNYTGIIKGVWASANGAAQISEYI